MLNNTSFWTNEKTGFAGAANRKCSEQFYTTEHTDLFCFLILCIMCNSICISLVFNQAFRNFVTSHKCQVLPVACCCHILVMQLSGGRVAFKLITKLELKEKIYSADCCLYFPWIVVDILVNITTNGDYSNCQILFYITLFLFFTFPSRENLCGKLKITGRTSRPTSLRPKRDSTMVRQTLSAGPGSPTAD